MYLDSELFKEGLKDHDIAKINTVAKADVHNHSGLGLRFDTFNKWAGGKVNSPPKKMNGIEDLDKYIMSETMKYIKTDKDVKFLIEETIKEAILDGVVYLEASIDCHQQLFYRDQNSFFDDIKNLKNKYSDKIDFRPEIGIPKTISLENLEQLVKPCIDSELFGSVDLYGIETDINLTRFKKYYQHARKKGLKLKAHAGEFSDYNYIDNIIKILDLDEVQHGLSAVNSVATMNLIKERNIRLNLCPTSNKVLGAVKDMNNYPVRRLYDNKVNITINTDDLLLFNSSVSEEYLYLYKLGIFNVDELDEIRINSLL